MKTNYPGSRTIVENSNRYQYLVDTFLCIFMIKMILGGRNWIQSTYRGRRLPGPKKIVCVLYVWTAQNSGHCNDKASLVLYPPRTKKVSKVNYSLNAKNCNVRGVSTFIF